MKKVFLVPVLALGVLAVLGLGTKATIQISDIQDMPTQHNVNPVYELADKIADMPTQHSITPVYELAGKIADMPTQHSITPV